MNNLHQILAQRQHHDDHKTKEELRAKLDLFIQAFDHLNDTAIPRDSVFDEKAYLFFPFPPVLFADILLQGYEVLGKDPSKMFLDVGCGIGTTILLAFPLFDAYGLDFNLAYIERAQQTVGKRAFHADALTFRQYNEFDFVYFFRPIYDDKLCLEFETKVYQQLKPGAIVAPVDGVFDWEHAPQIKSVGQFLYLKEDQSSKKDTPDEDDLEIEALTHAPI